MTLCIAWLNEDGIHLASDSRISYRNGDYTDIGIKTYEVPVNIYPPNDNTNDERSPLFSLKIGLSFVGNTVNSFVIKDTIIEFLKKLQVIPGYTEISLNKICELISKVYENVVNSSSQLFHDNSDTQFLLAGYCPLKNELECYHFHLIKPNDSYKSIFDKLFDEECKFHLLGGGENYARNIIVNGERRYLHVLQKVINDERCSSVGGFIQYGYIDDTKKYFEIFGFQYTVKDENGCLDSKYIIRGTEHFTTLNDLGFNVSYTFIAPFGITPYDEV